MCLTCALMITLHLVSTTESTTASATTAITGQSLLPPLRATLLFNYYALHLVLVQFSLPALFMTKLILYYQLPRTTKQYFLLFKPRQNFFIHVSTLAL